MKATVFPQGSCSLFFRSPANFLSSSISSPCRKLTRGRCGLEGLMSSKSSSSSSQSISSQPESDLTQVSKPKSPPPQFPWLIVGLGNPGNKYQGTRHNVGFEMVDAFADAQRISMNTVNFKALFGKGAIENVPVPIMLAKPQTFMNASGIGRPPGKMDTASYVLRQFSRQEQDELDYTLQTGVEAIRILLRDGINKSATHVNTKKSMEQFS